MRKTNKIYFIMLLSYFRQSSHFSRNTKLAKHYRVQLNVDSYSGLAKNTQ